MRIAVEPKVFRDGTAAVMVDGIRVAYVRPLGDGSVSVIVIPCNDMGLTPPRLPHFRSDIAAARRRGTAVANRRNVA